VDGALDEDRVVAGDAIVMPSGRSRQLLDGGLDALEMFSVFDCAWRMMPMPMPVLPSERSEVCRSPGRA
jgi:hypothetical protein